MSAAVARHLVGVLLAVALVGCSDADDQEPRAVAGSPTPVLPSAPPAITVTTVGDVPTVSVDDRLQQRFQLPGDPDFLMASGGLLWVGHADGKLIGIDPGIGEPRRTVRVARNPSGMNGACNGLGGDPMHLWTCAGNGVALVGPDAETAEPVPGVTKISDQGTLPVLGGRVWVLEGGGSTLTGLDVATGGDPQRIALPVRCVDAAAGTDDELWLACPGEGVGLRVEVSTGAATRVEGLRGVRAVAVGDDVYFGYRQGLARVDADTAQVRGALAVAGASQLFVTSDAVWVRGGGGTFLRRVDPVSFTVVEQITAPEQSLGSVHVAFGSVWASAYDDAALYRLAE